MNTVDLINSNLESMSRTEAKVASHFLGHHNSFALNTLEKVAKEAGVSTTTVLRFCRRLGFKGFRDFQESLRDDMKYQPDLPEKYNRTIGQGVSNELLARTIRMDILCIQETFRDLSEESLEEAVRLLSAAERVFCFGMRESFALAHYTYTRLLSVRSNVFILDAGLNEGVESLLSLKDGDVCVVYAFQRYTKQAIQILSRLKEQGTKVILVTSEPEDGIREYADLVLPCRVNAYGVKNSSAAPVCLANYFCSAVAMKYGGAALEHMKKTEELFKEFSIC